jgi:hypothetical protein
MHSIGLALELVNSYVDNLNPGYLPEKDLKLGGAAHGPTPTLAGFDLGGALRSRTSRPVMVTDAGSSHATERKGRTRGDR